MFIVGTAYPVAGPDCPEAMTELPGSINRIICWIWPDYLVATGQNIL